MGKSKIQIQFQNVVEGLPRTVEVNNSERKTAKSVMGYPTSIYMQMMVRFPRTFSQIVYDHAFTEKHLKALSFEAI